MRNLLVTAPIIAVVIAVVLYGLSMPLWIVICAALFSAPLVVLIALAADTRRGKDGQNACIGKARDKDGESDRK
ncbi:hypothetical protein [Poseidonocella sp. HB161398]|uniref:hypothetical protein n=1 Tax=Poseidonocella sp. HB161398 TaxID=2320855 RepID=UPI0011081A7B|nr:hypothetical protein [Poseidonocella sp. HB161398]